MGDERRSRENLVVYPGRSACYPNNQFDDQGGIGALRAFGAAGETPAGQPPRRRRYGRQVRKLRADG
jgi:hypothetical protein